MKALLKTAAEFERVGNNIYIDPTRPGGAWLFHGTAAENIKSIQKNGLQPKKAVKHNLAYQGGLGSARQQRTAEQKRSVHLTPQLDYASIYGQISRDGVFDRKSAPTVFATYHPLNELSSEGGGKLRQKQPEGSGARGFGVFGKAFLHEGHIPPERLVKVPDHVLKPVIDDLERKTPWNLPTRYKMAQLTGE